MPEATGGEAEDLRQHTSAFSVDCTSGFEDQSGEKVVRVLEVCIVLRVLLKRGVVLTGLFQANVPLGKGASDCDVDSEALALGPQAEGDVSGAAT